MNAKQWYQREYMGSLSRVERIMNSPLLLLSLFALLFATRTAFSSSSSAYPTVPGTDAAAWDTSAAELVPERREVYGNGRIFDISHRIREDLPAFQSKNGLGKFLSLPASIKNGSLANNSEMNMPTHTGTHVDAPGHFYDHYFDAGFDVDSLDLDVLNGPGLLIDVPRNSNITAEVMKSLQIPKGIRRVLFRTLNTDRKLMFKKEFDSTYVGFTDDGARWLEDNTDVKLVGVDYLSAASYDHLESAHLVFLKNREIILVEGLKLDDVKAGLYNIHCLPLRLSGAEGCPIRCILMK